MPETFNPQFTPEEILFLQELTGQFRAGLRYFPSNQTYYMPGPLPLAIESGHLPIVDSTIKKLAHVLERQTSLVDEAAPATD